MSRRAPTPEEYKNGKPYGVPSDAQSPTPISQDSSMPAATKATLPPPPPIRTSEGRPSTPLPPPSSPFPGNGQSGQ